MERTVTAGSLGNVKTLNSNEFIIKGICVLTKCMLIGGTTKQGLVATK